jgi:hypothetical protein
MSTDGSPEASVELSISRRALDVALGKVAAVVVLGGLLGWAVWQHSVGPAEAETLEPIGEEEPSLVFYVVASVLTGAVAAAAYEALGRGFGLIIGLLRRLLGS